MKLAYFEGFCPFELGDKVHWKDSLLTFTIDDILTIHSIKDDSVNFEIVAVSEDGGRTISSQNMSDFTLIK